MNLEQLGIVLEDLLATREQGLDLERRRTVALEELVGLMQIAVEAYTLLEESDQPDEPGGEVEVLRCP